MKPATTEPRAPWLRRALWFLGLWLASVLALSALAYAIRLVLLP